jgi:hypothetical protein
VHGKEYLCVLKYSATISLCLTLFPRAKFRRAQGGVKAHVLLDHDDYLPVYVLLTEAQRSDVKRADSFALNPGSIVAMDRGYNDYACSAAGPWPRSTLSLVLRIPRDADPCSELKAIGFAVVVRNGDRHRMGTERTAQGSRGGWAVH